MGKTKSLVVPNQDKIKKSGLNQETRRGVVIIVGPNTHQSDSLLVAKSAIIVKRKITFQTCVRVINIAKVVVAIEASPKTTDSVIKTIKSKKPMINMMTVNGTLMNKNLFAFSSQTKSCIVQSKPMWPLMR